jgi:energy-converting hydrogenase Eha subunit C
MFGFLIKKTFFDMYDNLIAIALLNAGFILVLAFCFYLPWALRTLPVVPFVVLGIGFFLLFAYLGGVSGITREISDFQRPDMHSFAAYLRSSLPSSLILAVINLTLLFLFRTAFPFYSHMDMLIGQIASSLLVWFLIIWILAFQYAFPIQSRLDRSIRKILKKMFLLLLDNPLFTLGLMLTSVLIFLLSLLTAFLLPGIATVLLLTNAGLRLRLYKYDYLEQHPESRKRIPWEMLLSEDRERVGKRTLKGMIFPWKE